ncbi:MAG: hypothetical protein ACX94C_00990 [Phycisphaerales bacterium]
MDNDSVQLRLKLSGDGLQSGEIRAYDLGQTLLGWDRILNLSYYATEATTLSVPESGTVFQSRLIVRRVDKGSVVVDVGLWFSNHAASGLIGAGSLVVGRRVLLWAKSGITTYIQNKESGSTFDDTVGDFEDLAKEHGVRLKSSRIESEDYVKAFGNALTNATVPLDSDAAQEILSLRGEDLDIVIDSRGRKAIRKPFTPPEIDPDAEGIVVAPVKFIRINKQTGNGIFEFSRPVDESQLGHQRFKCKDVSIRRRANEYTRSFHLDISIDVRMQRKMYDKNRSGHYWLIDSIVMDENDDRNLYDL